MCQAFFALPPNLLPLFFKPMLLVDVIPDEPPVRAGVSDIHKREVSRRDSPCGCPPLGWDKDTSPAKGGLSAGKPCPYVKTMLLVDVIIHKKSLRG